MVALLLESSGPLVTSPVSLSFHEHNFTEEQLFQTAEVGRRWLIAENGFTQHGTSVLFRSFMIRILMFIGWERIVRQKFTRKQMFP